LRYLQTLSSIAAEHNSTIIFPMPMNILDHFMGKKSKDKDLEALDWRYVLKLEYDVNIIIYIIIQTDTYITINTNLEVLVTQLNYHTKQGNKKNRKLFINSTFNTHDYIDEMHNEEMSLKHLHKRLSTRAFNQ
jgi:hypothetical protein